MYYQIYEYLFEDKKEKENFSNQNQVKQTAGLKVLLLRSRVFDLHLFWPLLSLHHALQVLLHSQPPPETESGPCSNAKTKQILSMFSPSVWCQRGLSAACPSACAGTIPSSPGGPGSSWQAVAVVQKHPTSSSRSDPGPCRSRRVVPESSPAGGIGVSVSAQALARGAASPQGTHRPQFQGSLASCGSLGWAGWCLGSVSRATTESKRSDDLVFGWWWRPRLERTWEDRRFFPSSPKTPACIFYNLK